MVVKAKEIEYDAAGYWYEGVVKAAKDSGIIQEGEFNNYDKRLITQTSLNRYSQGNHGTGLRRGMRGRINHYWCYGKDKAYN